jgi:hypothetical protein
LQLVQIRKATELTVAAEALRGTVLGGDAVAALDPWAWLAGCACGHLNRPIGESSMTEKKAANETKPPTVVANEPEDLKGVLKNVGGSRSDHWNNILANQTVQALWLKHSDPETRDKQFKATVAALIGIAPKDELEGMMAAQLIAAHNAAMECYRRAMIAEQTFEGRRENLAQATKLSRTHAALLDALNRHRGKGQQKVTVEHVHVHSRGQAVVGVVASRGVGIQRNQRVNPMQLPMHLSRRCGARTRSGSPCQSPAMPNGRCRMHGGPSPGAPKGNKNAFKHGRYSAKAVAQRREITALLRTMRALSGMTEDQS